MKQLFAVFLVIIMCMSLFCGCSSSSSSKTTDDSWKSKKWDEMNYGEKQKTYDYIKDMVEKSWY